MEGMWKRNLVLILIICRVIGNRWSRVVGSSGWRWRLLRLRSLVV